MDTRPILVAAVLALGAVASGATLAQDFPNRPLVQTPELAERFEKGGNRMLRMAPAETEVFIRSELAKWPPIIRQAGIAAQ